MFDRGAVVTSRCDRDVLRCGVWTYGIRFPGCGADGFGSCGFVAGAVSPAWKTVEVVREGSKKKNLLHFSLGGIMQKVLGRCEVF